MIKKMVARSRATSWRRAFSVLLMVALLLPLVVMAPAPDAQMEQAGEPNDTLNVASAYALVIGADRLWNEAPYLQGLGVSVNWD